MTTPALMTVRLASTSSPDRFALYEMMRDAWGEPLATAVITRMPAMDLSDIATKHDVEHTSILLRGEMAELRGEMGELRGELRGEMSELRGEMSELRAEFRGDMAELRAEFRASSRHTMITIIAAAVSIWLTFYLPQVL